MPTDAASVSPSLTDCQMASETGGPALNSSALSVAENPECHVATPHWSKRWVGEEAAVDARTDEQFFIMARTDALQQQGLEAAIERAQACVAAGADAIFAEAVHTLEQYQAFTKALSVPVLANITEFGQTPLYNKDELAAVGVKMVLYPLSAFRAMNKAALNVYESILANGDQKAVVDSMQTRVELYDFLNYHSYEQKLDSLFAQGKNK